MPILNEPEGTLLVPPSPAAKRKQVWEWLTELPMHWAFEDSFSSGNSNSDGDVSVSGSGSMNNGDSNSEGSQGVSGGRLEDDGNSYGGRAIDEQTMKATVRKPVVHDYDALPRKRKFVYDGEDVEVNLTQSEARAQELKRAKKTILRPVKRVRRSVVVKE